MNSSLLFILAFFGCPALMLVIASSVRPDNDAKNYLFAGVSFFVILLSTVSSIVGVACLLSGLVGISALYGFAIGVSVLAGFALVYPIIAYKTFSSPDVIDVFDLDLASKDRPARTVLYFLVNGLPVFTQRFFYYTYCLLVFCMLLVESLYLYIWITYNFGIFDGADIIFYFLFQAITIAYVQGNGYRSVLRTDRLQCLFIFAVCVGGLFYFAKETLFRTGAGPAMQYVADAMQISPGLSQVFPTSFNTIFCAIGLLILAGGWFLSSPDMWVRMSRSIQRSTESRVLLVGGSHTVSLKTFFVFAGILIGTLMLLPLLVGLAGFGEENFPGSTNILADKARFAIQKIIAYVPSGYDPAHTGVFGGYSELVTFGVLVIISMAAMTTIDTTAISLAQLKYDYDVNIARTAEEHGYNGRYRRLMINVFGYVLFMPPLIDVLLDKAGLLAVAGFIGMAMGGLAVGTFITIIVRILFADGYRAYAHSVWWRFLSGCLGATALWFLGYGLAKLNEGTDAGTYIPFEPEPWLNLGQMGVLQVVALTLAYWPIIKGGQNRSEVTAEEGEYE